MNVENTKVNETFSDVSPSSFGLEEGQKALVVFGIALFEGERCPEYAHMEYGMLLTTEEQIYTAVGEEKAQAECLKKLKQYGVVNYTQTKRGNYSGYQSALDEVIEKGYIPMTCGKRIKVKFEEFYGPSIADMLFTSCRLSPMFEHSKMRNEILEIYDLTKSMDAIPYNYEIVRYLNKITILSEKFIDEFSAVTRAYEIYANLEYSYE